MHGCCGRGGLGHRPLQHVEPGWSPGGRCCGNQGYHWRRFYSRQERIEQLKEYREALSRELSGVEEEIRRLSQESAE